MINISLRYNLRLVNSNTSMPENQQTNIDNLQYHSAIVLPPPNVTGVLHMGHALNIAIQDAIVRNNKINCKNICFIPGTDHAGIYTQILVMNKLGDAVNQMNHEEILNNLWQWKTKSEDTIIKQIKTMDSLIAWDRYKFSLDADIKDFVTQAFIDLYEKGLVFKAKMPVNWDIKLQTVVSDLETVNQEQTSKMWYIKYFIENSDDYIEVATTRPETIFADVAVCVHPDDSRYSHLIGSNVKVPILNSYVPIISDKRCLIDKGSGAVKIDPSHGFMDFDVAKEHDLSISDNVIDKNGMMCGKALEILPELCATNRFDARAKIVDILQQSNLITKSETINNAVPTGERSNSILEVILTDQWFFDIQKVSKQALDALDDSLFIYPNSVKNTYIHYLSNPKPWCISRQILWGHRMPIWHYGIQNQFVIAKNQDEARQKAGCHDVKQVSDVFDTWFSSTMWPVINTLNIQGQSHLYPNAMLITGRDLIFFWVSRMIVMCIGLTNKVPFHKVYCHGLIYDAKGQKMSKSKGNVIDPLDLFQKYGIDVVRCSLLQNAVPGYDLRFSEKNLDKSQKFLIKIRNAMLYIEKNILTESNGVHLSNFVPKDPINSWIMHKIHIVHEKITEYINDFKIHRAYDVLYEFIWNDFCGSYLEASKIMIKTHPDECYECFADATPKILKILQPFAPSISKDLWNKFKFEGDLLDPIHQINYDPDLSNEFDLILNSIKSIRSVSKAIYKNNPRANITIMESSSKIKITYRDIVTKLTGQNTFEEHQDSIRIPCGQYILFYNPTSNDEYILFSSKVKQIINEFHKRQSVLKRDLSNEEFLSKVHDDLIKQKQDELIDLEKELKLWTSVV